MWVCSSNEKQSFVTIFDANNPNNILECFPVCSAHLLCIASVAGISYNNFFLIVEYLGVHESEIRDDEEFRSQLTCDGGYLNGIPSDIGDLTSFGSVSYVEMKRIDSEEENESLTFAGIDVKASSTRTRDCK